MLCSAWPVRAQRVGERVPAASRASGVAMRIVVHRATSPIKIDGVMNEPAWQRAQPIPLPYEWSPGNNTPAPVRTDCRVTYDAANLYIGCRAYDPHPSQIRAHLGDRDNLSNIKDDQITILLDPFHDQRRGYEFRINALGVQMDALFSSSSEDFSWDGIWTSKGRITSDGYVVEVAIPFKTLSFPDTRGPQTWGIILGRSWPRTVRVRMRSIHTDQSNSCLMCQEQELVGLRGIHAGDDVELDPEVTSHRTDARDSLGAPAMATGPLTVKPGITARWGVTSSLDLDVTANPDFSQVEADVAQLETNQRYALYYPEKRPFFLQGADIFDVPGHLVFTRTVVDPTAGVKLTGKIGRYAVGAFYTRDRVNSLLFPGPQSSSQTLLHQGVDAGVVRVRRDVGKDSYVGALVTYRQATGYQNLLAEVDGMIRLSGSNVLLFGASHTMTAYPDSLATAFDQPTGRFAGRGAFINFSHRTRNWDVNTELDDFGPNLRADAGFFPQTGLRGGTANVYRTFWGRNGAFLNSVVFGANAVYFIDPANRLDQREILLNATLNGPLQSQLQFEVGSNAQRFGSTLFNTRTLSASLLAQPSGALSLGLSGSAGTDIDIVNDRLADVLRLGPSLIWRAGRHLNLTVSDAVQHLSLHGRGIETENLAQLEALYHFSLRAFFRAILQYRTIARNPDMYTVAVDRVDRHLFTQLLFSYKLNPLTVLFIGYSGDRSGLFSPPTDVPLTPLDRTLFVKLGYAWRP